MQQLWQRKWVRILTFSSWTTFIFLLSLVWTYPSDALVAEVEAAVNQSGALMSAPLWLTAASTSATNASEG